MEYTELSDYPLPSGRLTEWTLTAPEPSWRPDSRRPSFTHLEHARRAVAAGDSWYSEWIGTAFHIEKPFDADVLARTMQRWYARHEVFRSTLRSGDDGDLRRFTVDADAVRARGRVVGEQLSSTAVFEHIDEHFNTVVSPLRWPHCIAVTVEPQKNTDSFLFVFAADHTVMDAYTQVFAIDEVIAIYDAEYTGTGLTLPEFGSYVDFSEAERARTENAGVDDDAVRGWSAFFDAHTETAATQPDRMPGCPRPAVGGGATDTATASGNQASLSSWILDADQTERFHRTCKAAGANMQAGIYTALTIAAQRHAGDPQLRLINPIHTRSDVGWSGSAGWFVDIVPVHLTTGGADTFRAALGAVAASALTYQSVSATPYSVVTRLLDDPATRQAPQFVVSYIDLRGAQGAAQWARRNARVLRSATGQAPEVYLWINRVPTGTNISARFPSGAAGSAISDFISVFTGVVREIADAGDVRYAAESRAQEEIA